MATKKKYWEYHIILWDADRSKKLEKHVMVVQRQSEYVARGIVRKKYPLSKGYSEELNDYWSK